MMSPVGMQAISGRHVASNSDNSRTVITLISGTMGCLWRRMPILLKQALHDSEVYSNQIIIQPMTVRQVHMPIGSQIGKVNAMIMPISEHGISPHMVGLTRENTAEMVAFVVLKDVLDMFMVDMIGRMWHVCGYILDWLKNIQNWS